MYFVSLSVLLFFLLRAKAICSKPSQSALSIRIPISNDPFETHQSLLFDQGKDLPRSLLRSIPLSARQHSSFLVIHPSAPNRVTRPTVTSLEYQFEIRSSSAQQPSSSIPVILAGSHTSFEPVQGRPSSPRIDPTHSTRTFDSSSPIRLTPFNPFGPLHIRRSHCVTEPRLGDRRGR